MLLVLDRDLDAKGQAHLEERLRWMGLGVHRLLREGRLCLYLMALESSPLELKGFEELRGVDEVVGCEKPFRLASRDLHPQTRIVEVPHVRIGQDLAIMAGPCAVESREQIMESAAIVKRCGGNILRGGAFKPRTSPYSFQGMGEEGLRYMREAADTYGLAVISEVMDSETIPMACEYVDIIQVGARNMQNFSLLKALGRAPKAVMVKRGPSATYKELLMAAEYVLSGGNPNVILCERGIRTFETATRNTFDLTAIPYLKETSSLPVIADPSHGTGVRRFVPPMARASVAAGADGIMVEVHPDPDQAVSDKDQTIGPEAFAQLMDEIRAIAKVVRTDHPTESFRIS